MDDRTVSARPVADPIEEAQAQWRRRYPAEPDQALRVGAITSVMRVQQLLLARVEQVLRPFGLTFASYEALQLLAFSRSSALPLGLMGERLMVHPATVTNTVDRLEQRGLVDRAPDPSDGRRRIASLTPSGASLVVEATAALHRIGFGLADAEKELLADLVRDLRTLRIHIDDRGEETL